MKRYKTAKKYLKLDPNEKKSPMQKKIERIEQEDNSKLDAEVISPDLYENKKKLIELFTDCFDFSIREFTISASGERCLICYIQGMIDKNNIDKLTAEFLTKEKEQAYNNCFERIEACAVTVSTLQKISGIKDIVSKLLSGNCVIFIDDSTEALVLDIKGTETRSISEPTVESVIRGPIEAFVEDIGVCITQIRRRIKTQELKMSVMQLGKQSKTKVVVSYIHGIAEDEIVNEVKRRLNNIKTDIVFDGGQLQPYLEDNYLSPFPQTEVTERPDTSAAALAEGRVVILIDGTPFVLIVPTTFAYLFNASEDYYNRFYYATFIRMLRYLSFFITIFGPALYIGVTTYQPELLPAPLLITIANSRAEVPFPAILEALLMELTFEIIREAGARQPKTIGQALNIVGALVIGQLSVQAGLVSPAMIIVVSFTGLSSFLIPKINSSREISVIRFPMMLLGAFFGIFGLIMGLLVLLIHLVSLRSIGIPYMSPFTPISLSALKDTLVKLPEYLKTKRPIIMQNNNIERRKEKQTGE